MVDPGTWQNTPTRRSPVDRNLEHTDGLFDRSCTDAASSPVVWHSGLALGAGLGYHLVVLFGTRDAL
jgi:hypothetical protein